MSQDYIEQLRKKQISLSDKYYKEWENLFKCESLEKYYEGFHWKDIPEGYSPYTINEYYSIIKIKIAHYLFSRPHFLVTAKPGNADWNQELAATATQLKEDVLAAIVENPHSKYKEEIRLAFLDSIFRFGIIEVGYAADWIFNPRAGKPLLTSHTRELYNGRSDKIIREPDELPANERIYFKRIHAKRFRIGGVDAEYLHNCSWVGYYDFVRKSDLIKLPNVKNADRLDKIVTTYTDDYKEFSTQDNELLRSSDIIKVWHIWDLRAKKRELRADNDAILLYEQPFKRLPLFDHRWDLRTHGWYPIPPSFQWISPQDEINEAREQLRAHRKRFVRKFWALRDAIDNEEMEKFEKGPDGTVFIINRENAIGPVQNADLGAAIRDSFVVSSEDLKKISGTASEQIRGDRQTATETMEVSKRSAIREDYEAQDVQDWMCNIAREALLLARDKISIGLWVELTADPSVEGFLGEVQVNSPQYQWVTSEDLDDGYDFRISLDVVSLSPIKAEDEKKKFVEFLAIVGQFPQIAISPILIREAAYRVGYRNEKVIKEMQNMALINMLGMQQQAQMSQNGQPNQIDQIKNQLVGQMQ